MKTRSGVQTSKLAGEAITEWVASRSASFGPLALVGSLPRRQLQPQAPEAVQKFQTNDEPRALIVVPLNPNASSALEASLKAFQSRGMSVEGR